jgi:DNA-binding transcriptional regulator YiaG
VNESSRYYLLYNYLRHSEADEVQFSFAQIEALLGTGLPPSARAKRAWWSNRASGAQAAAWMTTRYRVVAIDLQAESVTFRKQRTVYHFTRKNDSVQWDGEAVQALRSHMNLTQSAFAELLGVRQQTVSEWEQGVYTPTRATAKYLLRIAEEADFSYTVNDEQVS